MRYRGWTICGVWTFPGGGALLVNIPCGDGRTTVSLVSYIDTRPVRIAVLP